MASLQNARKLGDGLLSFRVIGGADKVARARFREGFGCAVHHIVSLALHHGDFTFNDPAGACVTCTGQKLPPRTNGRGN